MSDEQPRCHGRNRAARLTPSQLPTHGQNDSPSVIPQHVHAVLEQRVDSVGIELAAPVLEMGPGRNVAHPGKAERAKYADPEPTDVEFPALDREARRAR